MKLKKLKLFEKYFDLAILILLVLVSACIAVVFRLNFLFTTLLFFGLPSLYLLYKNPQHLRKAAISGLLFGVLWGFSFDFVAEINQAWSWSTGEQIMFPGTFFGVISLDQMVWFFLWIFLVVLFYERFLERNVTKKISSNIQYSLTVGGILAAVVIILFFINPDYLRFPYTYLVLGILALCQFIYVILKRPQLFSKTLEMIPFFFFLYLVFELVAVYLGLWDFPGQYLGLVIIGGIQFPFEELFFWILMSSAVAVSYHELYVDDLK